MGKPDRATRTASRTPPVYEYESVYEYITIGVSMHKIYDLLCICHIQHMIQYTSMYIYILYYIYTVSQLLRHPLAVEIFGYILVIRLQTSI